jgi:hypothetical protein
MNLKKLSIAILLFSTAGCDEKEIDNSLVELIRKKAAVEAGIQPDTFHPKITFMDEDLYAQFLKLNCGQYSNGTARKAHCEEKLQGLKDKVLITLGEPYEDLYENYVESDLRVINEDCSKYEKEKRSQCKSDKEKIVGYNTKVLGRAYYRNRAEIYLNPIQDILNNWNEYYRRNYTSLSFGEREAYMYSTAAHEALHLAYYHKGILEDHHRLMKESGALERMLDIISDYLKIDRRGYHKDLKMKSLQRGIEEEGAKKRSKERQESSDREPDAHDRSYRSIRCVFE